MVNDSLTDKIIQTSGRVGPHRLTTNNPSPLGFHPLRDELEMQNSFFLQVVVVVVFVVVVVVQLGSATQS